MCNLRVRWLEEEVILAGKGHSLNQDVFAIELHCIFTILSLTLYKYSFPISQKTYHISVAKINQLMLFVEMVNV